MLYSNKLVRAMGLTHQEIADLLLEVIDNYNKGVHVYEKSGMRFEVGYMRTVSDGQMSPFSNPEMPNDIEAGHWRGEVSVLNLDTGRTIWFSPQPPRWIWHMGFYEGRGTSYHADPVALVELFTRKDRIFLTHEEFAEKKGKELKKDGIKLVGLSTPSEIAKQVVSEDAVARLEKIGNDGKIIFESKCSSYRIFTAYNDSVYNRFGCGILIDGYPVN